MSNADWVAAVTHFGQGYPNRVIYNDTTYTISSVRFEDGIRLITIVEAGPGVWPAGLAIELGQE